MPPIVCFAKLVETDNRSVLAEQLSLHNTTSAQSAMKHLIVLKVGFPTEQDSATFQDKGTEVLSLSRDKGTAGQAQKLAKGRARTVCPNL